MFEVDLADNEISLVSASDTGGTDNGTSDPSSRPSINSDGQFVGFESKATDIVPGVATGDYQAYLRDTVNDTTALGPLSASAPEIHFTGCYVRYGAEEAMVGTTWARSGHGITNDLGRLLVVSSRSAPSAKRSIKTYEAT